MTATVDTGLQQLREDMENADLGPIVAIKMVEHPDGGDAIMVELDKDSRCLARTLSRWLDLIIFHDMTLGKFHKKDRYIRFNVRGEFASGVRVVVTAPFLETSNEARAIDLWIETDDIDSVVTSLVALKNQRESDRRV